MLVEGGRGSSSSMWQALTSVPRVRAGANPAAASPAAASVLPTPRVRDLTVKSSRRLTFQ